MATAHKLSINQLFIFRKSSSNIVRSGEKIEVPIEGGGVEAVAVSSTSTDTVHKVDATLAPVSGDNDHESSAVPSSTKGVEYL